MHTDIYIHVSMLVETYRIQICTNVCVYASCIYIYIHIAHIYVCIDTRTRPLHHMRSKWVWCAHDFKFIFRMVSQCQWQWSKHVGRCTIISVASSNQRILYWHLWCHSCREWDSEKSSGHGAVIQLLLSRFSWSSLGDNYQLFQCATHTLTGAVICLFRIHVGVRKSPPICARSFPTPTSFHPRYKSFTFGDRFRRFRTYFACSIETNISPLCVCLLLSMLRNKLFLCNPRYFVTICSCIPRHQLSCTSQTFKDFFLFFFPSLLHGFFFLWCECFAPTSAEGRVSRSSAREVSSLKCLWYVRASRILAWV